MVGRKRHLLVDVLGLVYGVAIQPGHVQDRDGAKPLLSMAATTMHRLAKVWADQGYQGRLEVWAQEHLPFALEVVDKPRQGKEQRGFQVVPHRWKIERTFGWLIRCRRLVRDYEYLVECSEHLIYLAMIGLMVRRLAP